VELQELRPTHTGVPALRSGFHRVAPQDMAHRERVDVMPQIRQGTLDAAIAPGRILFGHADHKLFDLLGHTRSAKPSAMPAPVELLRDRAVVPALEGVGRRDRGNLLQALTAERVGSCRQAPAFRVGEAEPAAAELGFEDMVFRL
jgi:hypothetical protein